MRSDACQRSAPCCDCGFARHHGMVRTAYSTVPYHSTPHSSRPGRQSYPLTHRLPRSKARSVKSSTLFYLVHVILLYATLLTSDTLLFPIQYSILIYIAFDTRALGLSLPLAPSGLTSCTCRHWYTSCVTLLTTRWHAVDTRLTLFHLFAPPL